MKHVFPKFLRPIRPPDDPHNPKSQVYGLAVLESGRGTACNPRSFDELRGSACGHCAWPREDEETLALASGSVARASGGGTLPLKGADGGAAGRGGRRSFASGVATVAMMR